MILLLIFTWLIVGQLSLFACYYFFDDGVSRKDLCVIFTMGSLSGPVAILTLIVFCIITLLETKNDYWNKNIWKRKQNAKDQS